MRIKHLVKESFETTHPYAVIDSIEKRLIENRFLVVVDDVSFLGILTPSDIIESPHGPVIDCLHDKPRIAFEQDIDSVLILMKESRNSVLPVFKGEEFVGVVTQADVTDYLFEYQDELKRGIPEHTAELAKANEQLKRGIKERKRVEEALDAERKRLFAVFDQAPVHIYLQAQDHSIPLANGCFRKRFGDPEGRCCYEVIARRVCPCKPCRPFSVFHTKKPIEWEWAGTDGRTYLTYDCPFSDIDGSPLVLALGVDITECKQIEARVQQAGKMEAIRTLAGGMAHEFNNLLMGILGNASLMLLGINSSHPHYKKLKNIKQCVKRGADLTKQLLGFARIRKYDSKPTDLNELIENTCMMFGQTKKEIKIHREYQEDIWAVEVDRGQIRQALLDLYANAWHAMPGGGELYIQTENVTLDEGYVDPYHIRPGYYVKISITDSGAGLDEKNSERIFDPFFTTHIMGRGTGLGLAYAYGVIKNHGGMINVHSEKGKGTRFNIFLPYSEKAVTKEEEKLSEEILKGTETVLLVDDEDVILDVGKNMLTQMGYKVLLAAGGKEAVEVYRKNKEKINLVILDILMPDMGGGEVYDALKEIKPDIKVLLSSGYSISGQATDILKRGCDGFIPKPFNISQMSEKIREILDKK
jgi:nitrogen-specific signal transduction histidine kinase/ActR/RegA family two-component response regulator